MCHKAINACLPSLKFLPDWLVTNKMLEKLDNDEIDLDYMDSDIVTCFIDGMGLVTIALSNISLGDDNFDEDDPEIIIQIRLKVWCNIL